MEIGSDNFSETCDSFINTINCEQSFVSFRISSEKIICGDDTMQGSLLFEENRLEIVTANKNFIIQINDLDYYNFEYLEDGDYLLFLNCGQIEVQLLLIRN